MKQPPNQSPKANVAKILLKLFFAQKRQFVVFEFRSFGRAKSSGGAK
jgi:hypothetical protein